MSLVPFPLRRDSRNSVRIAEENPRFRLVRKDDLKAGATLFMVKGSRFDQMHPFRVFILDPEPIHRVKFQTFVRGIIAVQQFDHHGRPKGISKLVNSEQSVPLDRVLGKRPEVDPETHLPLQYWLPLGS